MIFDNQSDGTVIVGLNNNEMDQLFDPFDPSDDAMPSHLHHVGHRYIKTEVYEWMVENIGRPMWDWSTWVSFDSATITLRDSKKSLLFKLTWGGQCN